MKLTRISPALALAAFLLSGPVPAAAQEHPEHPNAAKKVDVDALESAIKAKVAEKTKDDGGVFKISDDVLKKTWDLDLVRVHRDKLTQLEDGRYFACVDMKDHGGNDLVDVDFFLKDDDGHLVFSDMAIHKVNGVPRYNWEKKGDRWVKAAA